MYVDTVYTPQTESLGLRFHYPGLRGILVNSNRCSTPGLLGQLCLPTGGYYLVAVAGLRCRDVHPCNSHFMQYKVCWDPSFALLAID